MPQAAGIPGAAARSPGGATLRVVESLRGALPGTAQWGALWTHAVVGQETAASWLNFAAMELFEFVG